MDHGRIAGVGLRRPACHAARNYPGLPAPVTKTYTCIVWSTTRTQPGRVEPGDPARYDVLYWPPEWIKNRPGMFRVGDGDAFAKPTGP